MTELEMIGETKKKVAQNKQEERNSAAVTTRQKAAHRISVAPQEPLQEESLTAEEWAEKIKTEEEVKARPKLLTKEEFLAMRDEKAKTAAAQAHAQKKSAIIDRLIENADTALGTTPVHGGATPNNTLEEVKSASGLITNMKENPLIAGVVTLIGLITVFIGMHIADVIVAVSADVLGFVVVVIGAIFIFGHTKNMRHR